MSKRSSAVSFSVDGEILSPPLNVYAGRDTSSFALLFDGDDGRSRTSQEHAEDADVNTIMSRYIKSGTIPVFLDRVALEGDLHEMSYHEMQNAIADANTSFASLPAHVRARFDNDPGAFIEFCSKDENIPEMRSLGLLSPEALERLDTEAAQAAEVAAKAAEKAAKPPKGSSKEEPATQ